MLILRLVLSLMAVRLLAVAVRSDEPDPILLWPRGAPGSEGKTGPETVRLTEQGEHIVSSVHRPSLTPYLPEAASATGAAVIVIPGGGHRELWMDHEGYRVGRWLRDHGIAAFVLKYRLARQDGSTYTVERDELADAHRAIRLVRSRAAEWGLSPEHIGVLGFSAGGELALLAGTRFDAGAPAAADPVDRVGSRPAFMGLIYPGGSSGAAFNKDTPPAFLLAGDQDAPSVSDGLPALYAALRRAGASAELHMLSGIGHGFGLRDNNPPPVAAWPMMFRDWLEAKQFLVARGAEPGLSPQMRDGIAGARPVPVYAPAERARAAQQALGLAQPPALGETVSLTPNAPHARGGAHLSFWKPAFLLGTADGGEAGVNFWGIHNEGHVNVGFMPTVSGYLLDCRLLSAGPITWKIFTGPKEAPGAHGEAPLRDFHFLLQVPARPGEPVSVELWPTPVTEPLGFLGCELSEAAPAR